MRTKSLTNCFVFLIILCAGFVSGTRMMDEHGIYLAG